MAEMKDDRHYQNNSCLLYSVTELAITRPVRVADRMSHSRTAHILSDFGAGSIKVRARCARTTDRKHTCTAEFMEVKSTSNRLDS